VVFVGSVQALDELLQGSPLFGLGIKVLEANNLPMLDIEAIILSIEEMDTCGICGIAVANEDDFLIRRSGSDSFPHGNNGRQSTPVVGKVIGGNLEALGRDEEESVVVLAEHFDVGFIAC